MTALDFIQWTSRCPENPAHDAAWVSTPTEGPRYSCKECETPAPVPATAWGWRQQIRRWVDTDGRALL